MQVILNSSTDVKKVLKEAPKLKDGSIKFSKIYLKRDMHPMIRREYDRLRKVVRAEKERAENQGRNVFYDKTSRTVKIDETVIDRFSLG